MVEVDERSCCVAGDIDLEGLCPDPVVLRAILVDTYYRAIAFSSMEDDVVRLERGWMRYPSAAMSVSLWLSIESLEMVMGKDERMR